MLVAVVFVAAGCGSSNHKPASPRTTTTSSTTTSTTKTASAPLPGIVSFTFPAEHGTATPQDWRVTIYDLRRNGPFATLDFRARCLVSGSLGCDGGAFFNENEIVPGPPGEIRLIDTANNMAYWPVTDSHHQTYGSQSVGGNASLPASLLWVTFPAPPTSVKTVDIAFPHGGPQVPGVPITTAATGPTLAQAGAHTVAARRTSSPNRRTAPRAPA
jgi:hypothetical protein